jgi:cytoskeleton protein RodZ
MTDMAENQELRVRERAPGAALSAARTAQNLSLTDVARQLKLSVNQVAALEAGEFERLPGPVFVRGFVRNYARLLKLDPERIVDAIMPDLSEQEEAKELPAASREIPFPSERTRARRWPGFALAVLVVLVGLAAYEFYWHEPGDATVTRSAPTAAFPPAAEQSASTALPMTASGVASQSESAGTAPQAPEAASEGAQPPLAASEAGDGELRFTFAKDSWVQVRERSGKTIFTRLNPAGSAQRVSGKPPLMLVIGNAHGVRVTYNERPVDLEPYIIRDDVARFTLE